MQRQQSHRRQDLIKVYALADVRTRPCLVLQRGSAVPVPVRPPVRVVYLGWAQRQAAHQPFRWPNWHRQQPCGWYPSINTPQLGGTRATHLFVEMMMMMMMPNLTRVGVSESDAMHGAKFDPGGTDTHRVNHEHTCEWLTHASLDWSQAANASHQLFLSVHTMSRAKHFSME